VIKALGSWAVEIRLNPGASRLYSRSMRTGSRADLVRVVAARVVDLRAEFEAQLRAVGRVEEQLRKVDPARDESASRLSDVLQRELREMLTNNRNIRTVLNDLVKDVGNGTARLGPDAV
jgi:hypothetical protein